jgi:serine/threonine-protein kinase RIM15
MPVRKCHKFKRRQCRLTDVMCIVDGEGAARYIKSTNGKNTNTPIIAVSAYSGVDPIDNSNLFTAYLAKPLQKTDLIAVMRQLGFKTSPIQGGAHHPKVTTSQPQSQPQSQPLLVST